jgi:hypothetical protein
LREAAEKQDVPQELDRLVFERINNQGREPETGER